MSVKRQARRTRVDGIQSSAGHAQKTFFEIAHYDDGGGYGCPLVALGGIGAVVVVMISAGVVAVLVILSLLLLTVEKHIERREMVFPGPDGIALTAPNFNGRLPTQQALVSSQFEQERFSNRRSRGFTIFVIPLLQKFISRHNCSFFDGVFSMLFISPGSSSKDFFVPIPTTVRIIIPSIQRRTQRNSRGVLHARGERNVRRLRMNLLGQVISVLFDGREGAVGADVAEENGVGHSERRQGFGRFGVVVVMVVIGVVVERAGVDVVVVTAWHGDFD
mmetsp:Transcript_11370/g.22774  ORF Transcript_11370/g.22774 Transcript_11370/m.22774 type:complete len:276 (-) Transcript_11370:142-969(-)